MKKEYNDEYNKIIKDIINNEYFLKTKEDLHHGTNKYDHLIRVSKCSFIIGKLLHANVRSLTRAAILHDFFYGSRTEKEENSYLNHPKTAAKNAKEVFNISTIEEDTIKTHMFHHVILKKLIPFINIKEKANFKENKPKSKEGWILCLSDLLVSIHEAGRFELSYVTSLSFLVILNILFIKH